jgi:hypothetical protein
MHELRDSLRQESFPWEPECRLPGGIERREVAFPIGATEEIIRELEDTPSYVALARDQL